MKKTFYSNGKLLLTAEYTVLDGAKALALPTVFGQNLSVEENTSEDMIWKSYDADKSIWIDVVFRFSEIINRSFTSENPFETRLADILFEAYSLQPSFLEKGKGYKIETQLTFPRLWGLGTSSTLVNNIAHWLEINPYELLQKTFSGSGYDIACAQNNKPVLYYLENGKPITQCVDFYPDFSDKLYFIYLNRKQNSRSAIASYYARQPKINKTIEKINTITTRVLAAQELSEFAYLLEKHEVIMSDVLEMQTVKEAFFSDFNGVVKSLGAWGGDFVLAISEQNPTSYFKSKGFDIIVPYQQMILPPTA